MSYYYSYYIGYEKDGKIYPLGPYDSFGKLHSVFTRSRSFASDLHYDFNCIPSDKISDELEKEFNYHGDFYVKYLYLSDLPKGDFVKKSYFLIRDVTEYERQGCPDEFDGFYDHISPDVYAAMMLNELKFGKPAAKTDLEGVQYTPKTASDYMYYAFVDTLSEEYEAFLIRQAAEMLETNMKIVVLETEG